MKFLLRLNILSGMKDRVEAFNLRMMDGTDQGGKTESLGRMNMMT